MGRATIVSHIGDSLYTATPLWDFTALDREVAQIDTAETTYPQQLLNILNTVELLTHDVVIAGAALDAVIQQWKDQLIKLQDDHPPPLVPPTPNDPETGQPWEDPDRAQEPPLLEAINAARTNASVPTVARQADLNQAALRFLRDQKFSGRMGHLGEYGSTPANRVAMVGYAASAIGENLAYGPSTPDAVITAWLKDQTARETLFNPDYQDVGIAYVYAIRHSAVYLWCALFAAPGTPPAGVSTPITDPAKKASEDAEDSLTNVAIPRTDPLTPQKLAEVLGEYGKAVAKKIAAEKELEKTMLDHLNRLQRQAELAAIKTALREQVHDLWCCYSNESLNAGAIVYTAEVPGFWMDAPIRKSVVVAGHTRVYDEYHWNIVPRFSGFESRLTPTAALRGDTMFYNVALEPATIQWKPAWRYGTITDIADHVCTIRLEPVTARQYPNREALTLVEDGETITSVPFNYPPCNDKAFEIGDEVLIRYRDFQLGTPEVVGFRRLPRDCWQRTSWRELI